MFQRNHQDFCTLVCVFKPLLSQTEGHRVFGRPLWFILPSVCIQTVHVMGHTTSQDADMGPTMDVLHTWLTVEMMFSWREYLRSRMNLLCVRACTSTGRSAPLVACWNMTWRCCFIAFTEAAATPTASQESRVSAHNTCHSLLTNKTLQTHCLGLLAHMAYTSPGINTVQGCRVVGQTISRLPTLQPWTYECAVLIITSQGGWVAGWI